MFGFRRPGLIVYKAEHVPISIQSNGATHVLIDGKQRPASGEVATPVILRCDGDDEI